MARRTKKTTLADDLLEMLCRAPTWVGPLLALAAFAFSRWAFPAILAALGADKVPGSQAFTRTLADLAVRLSPLAGLAVVVVWLVAEGKKWSDRRRLDSQTGPESINALDWLHFESLLSEAFRRQGFAVENFGRPAPDGGVDQRLTKAGAVTLVQCKHWRTRSVGVKIVRELLGVVASEGAQSGIVVSSGMFTPDAIAFAATNPIRLIDGNELAKMIGAAQSAKRQAADPPAAAAQPPLPPPPPPRAHIEPSKVPPPPPAAPPSDAAATCPTCAAPMVRRVARTGKNAGQEFLGCSRYPTCRGTRSLGSIAH